MTPFTTHTGIVATLNRANVDTDAIIPKQFLSPSNAQDTGRMLFSTGVIHLPVNPTRTSSSTSNALKSAPFW